MVDENTEAAAPEPPPPMTPPPVEAGAPEETFEDPDDVALLEEQKAVEAEEAPEAAPEEDQPEPEPPAEPAAEAPQTVPIERFNEVVDQRNKARAQAIYLKGLADGAKAPEQSGEPEPPPASPEERIADVRAREKDLAQKYDDGDLTMSEYVEQSQGLRDEEAAVRQELVAPAAQSEPREDLALAQETQKIREAHPYIDKLSKRHVDFLVGEAYDQAAADGRPIGTGVSETLRLRSLVGQLSDRLGPGLVGETPSVPAPAGQDPQPSGDSALSEAAKDRLAKIEKQGQFPPDTGNLGTVGEDPAEILLDEAALSRMSEEELLDLPQELVNKVLYS